MTIAVTRQNALGYTLKRNASGVDGDDWQSLKIAVYLRVSDW